MCIYACVFICTCVVCVYVQVSDNVCYLHMGHGYFLEDAVEQNITLDRNLGVGTLHGSLLLSDRHQDWCRPIGDYCE